MNGGVVLITKAKNQGMFKAWRRKENMTVIFFPPQYFSILCHNIFFSSDLGFKVLYL